MNCARNNNKQNASQPASQAVKSILHTCTRHGTHKQTKPKQNQTKPPPLLPPFSFIEPPIQTTTMSYSCELKGKGWIVENATKEQGVIEVEVTSMGQTVAVYGGVEATVVIKGKCNSISVMGCKKTKILCDSVVSYIEISNSARMQLQVKVFAPSIAIDKTDGCLVYLSKKCIDNPDFNITASKSSEMNVSFPYGPDEEYIEKPLPEQFVYKLDLTGDTPKVTSSVSDLYSS
jgi:hypothetical protein